MINSKIVLENEMKPNCHFGDKHSGWVEVWELWDNKRILSSLEDPLQIIWDSNQDKKIE